MRGGRQERLPPQPASCSRFCVLGDESSETRPAGAELEHNLSATGGTQSPDLFIIK